MWRKEKTDSGRIVYNRFLPYKELKVTKINHHALDEVLVKIMRFEKSRFVLNDKYVCHLSDKLTISLAQTPHCTNNCRNLQVPDFLKRFCVYNMEKRRWLPKSKIVVLSRESQHNSLSKFELVAAEPSGADMYKFSVKGIGAGKEAEKAVLVDKELLFISHD